jgi:hypothetical protein
MTTSLCYEGWDSIKTHTLGFFTKTDSDMTFITAKRRRRELNSSVMRGEDK